MTPNNLPLIAVHPSDLFRNQTQGVSKTQMVRQQMLVASKELERAARDLIALDQKLTDDYLKGRVRDSDYATFKLVFTPYVTELIFHHRTPQEYRKKVKALRGKLIISGPSIDYMFKLSRVDYHNGIGKLCTTVLSKAFASLGLFASSTLPLMVKDFDDTITLIDSVNEMTNDHWPNVNDVYERLYSNSVKMAGGFEDSFTLGLRLEEFPKIAGIQPSFEKVSNQADKSGSDPPLKLLTSISYTLN